MPGEARSGPPAAGARHAAGARLAAGVRLAVLGGRVLALGGHALDLASALLMAAIAALVFAQALIRYVLGGSLVWSEELTRVLFVWMVLIAATRAAPMRIDLMLGWLPRRSAAFLSLFGECIVMGLTCVLVWGAWGMAELTENDSFIALGIPVSWIYLGLFAAGLLWLLRALVLAGAHAAALVSGPRP